MSELWFVSRLFLAGGFSFGPCFSVKRVAVCLKGALSVHSFFVFRGCSDISAELVFVLREIAVTAEISDAY